MELSEDILNCNKDVQGKQCVSGDSLDNGDLIYDDIGYENLYEAPDMRRGARTPTEDRATPKSTQQLNQSGCESLQNRTSYLALCLGLLSVLLLAGLIGLSVYYSNQTAQLQGQIDQLQNRNLTVKRCCPDGWIVFGNSSCYYASNQNKTWNESRRDCLDRGADLVTIKSQAEEIFVNGLHAAGSSSWIGLSYSVTVRTWKWVDNTSLTNTTFWAQTPSGTSNGCVALGFNSGQGQWWNWGCFNSTYWICETT